MLLPGLRVPAIRVGELEVCREVRGDAGELPGHPSPWSPARENGFLDRTCTHDQMSQEREKPKGTCLSSGRLKPRTCLSFRPVRPSSQPALS